MKAQGSSHRHAAFNTAPQTLPIKVSYVHNQRKHDHNVEQPISKMFICVAAVINCKTLKFFQWNVNGLTLVL